MRYLNEMNKSMKINFNQFININAQKKMTLDEENSKKDSNIELREIITTAIEEDNKRSQYGKESLKTSINNSLAMPKSADSCISSPEKNKKKLMTLNTLNTNEGAEEE